MLIGCGDAGVSVCGHFCSFLFGCCATFGEGAMGVGLYSVSCGYGCGCGFGGLTSLIAMVLALRAREALRMGMGGKVFSGPSLRCGARSVRRSASRRLVIANGDQRPLAPKCRAALRASRATPSPPHPAAPLGSRAAKRRPVSFAQNLATREGQRPRCTCGGESRAARTLPLPEAFVLRALPSPFTFRPPSVRG